MPRIHTRSRARGSPAREPSTIPAGRAGRSACRRDKKRHGAAARHPRSTGHVSWRVARLLTAARRRGRNGIRPAVVLARRGAGDRGSPPRTITRSVAGRRSHDRACASGASRPGAGHAGGRGGPGPAETRRGGGAGPAPRSASGRCAERERRGRQPGPLRSGCGRMPQGLGAGPTSPPEPPLHQAPAGRSLEWPAWSRAPGSSACLHALMARAASAKALAMSRSLPG